MIKTKSTKKALISSVIALVLCFTMLLGTTFAWFTDSVTSAGNKIVAGNLDVDLYMWTSATESIEITNETAPIFGEGAIAQNNNAETLWEPGKTQVAYLSIKNNGSLDLKYKVAIEVYGASDKLIEVMTYAITPDATFGNAPAWNSDYATAVEMGTNISANNVSLLNGEEHFFALSVHMDELAGNEYMNESVTFDIKVLAGQLASEEDSFGSDYDKIADNATPVASVMAFFNAIENGEDVLLEETLKIDADFIGQANARNSTAVYTLSNETVVVNTNAVIDGNGSTIYRTKDTIGKPLFEVASGYTLTLSNITLDGGAVWSGKVNPVLLRGTENVGMTTSGALVAISGNGSVVLEEGAVLQNNDGANAVHLGTRTGGTLVVDGGEIINNHSAAGAIYGGGAITLNSGKINGNHGGIGGAIRVVTNVGTVLTMNGGEMNHNYSDGNGGAIWAGSSRSSNVYVLNGGEMAYNYSATTGGAIYAGYYETVKIGGTFKMHDNDCAANIGSAIRFHDHASLVMTGGEIYNHDDNAFFLYNNSATITGGKYEGNFGYSGGLGLTIGEAEIDGIINYSLGTNHNTAYLAAEFGSFEFTVNESASNFAQFNFKPATDYTYTEGDEAKLICMNEGYETYWDAATSTFRLKAVN